MTTRTTRDLPRVLTKCARGCGRGYPVSPELTGDNSLIPRDALSNVKFPRDGFVLCSRHWKENRTRRWATPIQIPTIWTISSFPRAKRKVEQLWAAISFASFREKELSNARKGYTPSNTAKNNIWAESLFLDWLGERNATIRDNGSQKDHTNEMGRLTLLSNRSDEELSTCLSRLLMEVRKTKGEEYPPFDVAQFALPTPTRRPRAEKRPTIDFFRDAVYAEMRNTMDVVCRSLHGRGFGAEKRRTSSISYNEEEALWSKTIIGVHNPTALLRAVFFLNGKNFCLRGREEHRKLSRTKLIRDPPSFDDKVKSYNYVENGSKNNPGGRSGPFKVS